LRYGTLDWRRALVPDSPLLDGVSRRDLGHVQRFFAIDQLWGTVWLLVITWNTPCP
jgi:hypothetical protein